MTRERTTGMQISQVSNMARSVFVLTLAVLMVALAAPGAQAQNLFSPARQVNDRVITNYDVEQRIAFMTLLNAGAADMRAEALSRLTEEAVQREQARRLNLRVDADELAEGMAEFASRADLSTEDFINVLNQNGIDSEAFAAFVEAGLLWRKVVARQLPALISVSGSDVERARDVVTILGRQRVLISEIFLPTDPQFAEAVGQIMQMIESARSVEEFSRIAREFSLAGSRDQGGRLPDWVAVENLPGQIAGPLAAALPGQIIGPIDMTPEVFAYFQLRASDSSREIPPERVTLRYKRLLLPGGDTAENRALVSQMQAQVRHCEGLGPYARGLPEPALVEIEGLVRELSPADATELARLDRNQISASRSENGQLVVLMLCSRELQFDERPSDSRMRDMVFDRRLDALAALRLQELIADADIRDF